MKKAFFIVMVLITTSVVKGQNKKQYPYADNIPTRSGIQHYIDQNQKSILGSVENFIGDSIRSYSIRVDDLSEYLDPDSLEAGRFYPEDEIIISNEGKFYDYELSFVPKWKQKEFNYNTRFVKSVLIHEFIHLYIYQFIYDCLDKHIPINSEYINFNLVPRIGSYYSSELIEEGICEYVVMKLREGIFNEFNLECQGFSGEGDLSKLMHSQNINTVKYQYSRLIVERIFENNSFRESLQVIFTAKPPTYEELLCPEKYYNRLNMHAEDAGFNGFRIETLNQTMR